MEKEIYEKIIKKKEFSDLPKKDVEMAFSHFEKREVGCEEKVRLTRELLHKVYSGFTSQKLLSLKDKNAEWLLNKHLSTRERFFHYEELYRRLLNYFGKELTIFDLGCGINGLSYKYLPKGTGYVGIEAIGQLVKLQSYHFKTRGIENCQAIHKSLFELEKIKKYIKQVKGNKIIFLFKTIDSLEMIKRDYSKELLRKIVPLVDRVVVSFALMSMKKRQKFKVKRSWIKNFIGENFKILDDFTLGGEEYIVFKK